jgi:Zn-dependent protease with chaperone function
MRYYIKKFCPRLICLSLLLVMLTSCALEFQAVPNPPAVLGPQSVAARENPVTTAPSANFLSGLQIKQSAKQRAEALFQQHSWKGHQILRPGDTDPRYKRLTRHFNKILSVSHLHKTDVYPVLITDPQFQALTFGGDEVIFYTGLTERLNDDALAFVIAHELAHIAAGHVGEASSLAVSNVDAVFARQRQNDLYSFGHEREADKIALVYLLLAGYEAESALFLWQALAENRQNGAFDLFVATHPASADRARDLRENVDYFRQNVFQYNQGNLLNCNPLYCNKQGRS